MTSKAIIFSITAMLMLSSLIIVGTNIALRINSEETIINREIPARIDRALYSTISSNIARAFGTSVTYGKNLTINDQLVRNISKAVSDYETFLNNISARSAITKRENSIYIGDKTRIDYGSNKSWLNMTSNETISYFEINVKASDAQANVTSNWTWTSTGTFVNIIIMDLNGNTALINGSTFGRVNTSSTNTVEITYAGSGKLRIELAKNLLINTTIQASTNITTDAIGEVYTGYEVVINDTALESVKNYRTIIK